MKFVASVLSILLSAVAAPVCAQVADGSFEQQGAASTSGYCYFTRVTAGGAACGAGAWQGNLFGGLQEKTNGAWAGVATPTGAYYAFIQERGSISQDLTLAAGTYSLSWLAAGRAGYGGDQGYNVLLDGSALFNGSTSTGQAFTAVSTDSFTLAVAGLHTLTFQGLVVGDQTAFIDNVAIQPVATATAAVPEPATWALMMLGFGGVGHAMRRRPKLAVRTHLA